MSNDVFYTYDLFGCSFYKLSYFFVIIYFVIKRIPRVLGPQ